MKKRSTIELLRIISMLMIVYHHYSVHSKWVFPEGYSIGQNIIEITGSFGKIGVAIFALITGYFIKDFTWKSSKLKKLWFLVTFYSIFIYMTFLLSGKISLSRYFWVYFFPIPLSLYWYPTVYFFVYLSLPLLKKFLSSIDNKRLMKFLILFSIATRLPDILKFATNTDSSFRLTAFSLLIMLTLIGYLIREYEANLIGRYKRLVLTIFLISLTVVILAPRLIYLINQAFSVNFPHYFIAELASINTLLFSISFFSLFLRVTFYNSFLNYIGSCMFAILLIHDNPIMRDFLWVQLFKNSEHLSGPLLHLILRTALIPMMVFLGSLVIEIIRKNFVQLFMRLKISIPSNVK
jgi:surface polysaccharide O-acyltransferase-like enzyme